MNSPCISILMPVRNATPYLKECLDSILKQTYHNWELIAVDDFSTDNSWEILNSYSKSHDRIYVFKNEEKGIIPALKLAYLKAKGELITRMDADDYMSDDKLALFAQAMLQKGIGSLGVGLVEYISEDKIGDGYKNYADWLNRITLSSSNYQEVYKECVIPSPNWMLYRSDLDSIGAFDNTRYPEDYDLCFRMYQKGLTINPIDSTTHFWRDHNNRASRNDPNYEDNRFLDIKLFYYLKIDYNIKRPLILWGAGKKGKYIAQYFLKKGLQFIWITNNPKKVDVDIYGKTLIDSEVYLKQESVATQCIIAVANKEEQKDIKTKILTNQKLMKCFWFC